MAGSVKSGVLEFSDDQKVFVAVDEDDEVKKAVLIDREGNETALGALPTDEQVQEAVDAWLDDHPEATTTVQDGAITTAKLFNGSVTDDKLAADGIKAEVADLKTDLHYYKDGFNYLSYTLIKNSYPTASGTFPSYSNWDRTDYIPVSGNQVFYFINTRSTLSNVWYDENKDPISEFTIPIGNPTTIVAPTNARYMVVSNEANKFFSAIYTRDALYFAKEFFTNPNITFTDGKYFNTNGIITDEVGYSYAKINVSMFADGNVKGVTAVSPNQLYGIGFTDEYDNLIIAYTHTTVGTYVYSYDIPIPSNAVYFYISLRNASADKYVAPSFYWGVIDGVQEALTNLKLMQNQVLEDKKELENARQIPNDSATPLTLVHFSDLHANRTALGRIITKSNEYSNLIDDYICTGDMVANTSAQIKGWWKPKVLTCIGNHDSASYNSGTGYNWTALSMADRDVYYIAPFENNWGITHTSGTSYYYKDYLTQKVRLIVMDGMLYTDNGAEATAQTSWLASLLSDAITNNLHVVIAIHAPHGGATSKECSFSRYNQGAMPTYEDCNTPQTVIDTVATAIGNGLKFIGYLVGHTHQDNIWDADGDGKQLMYCVTCATTTKAQWVNSDQFRGADADAFNVVTIDTANTLVKIVRGGGADIDDHMRTRKAICFNYSTGEVVGEVL